MAVFARGLLHHLYTRVYLPGTPIEPALAAQLSAERAATLMAAAEPGGFRFDVHLQGEHETVFLEFG
jgi:protocatechuate 3,4-dioxygenase alpha subunit